MHWKPKTIYVYYTKTIYLQKNGLVDVKIEQRKNKYWFTDAQKPIDHFDGNER